jgi:hypothetical protein
MFTVNYVTEDGRVVPFATHDSEEAAVAEAQDPILMSSTSLREGSGGHRTVTNVAGKVIFSTAIELT